MRKDRIGRRFGMTQIMTYGGWLQNTFPLPQNPYMHKLRITEDFFPIAHNFLNVSSGIDTKVPISTEEELKIAVEHIKTGKAPGPGQLLPEVVKILAEMIRKISLKVHNYLLECQEFTEQWKEARVVLIQKGKPMDLSSSNRLICLLSILVELFERLIKGRLGD